MRTLLATLLILSCVWASAQTQPNFIPRVNGGGTNTTVTNAIVHDQLLFKSGTGTNFAMVPILTSVSFLSGGVTVGGVGNLGGGTGYAWTFSTNLVMLGGVMIGDGFGITNVLEKNVAVTTNNWSTADVDFSRGTSIERTLSGNLSISGISGFVTSNLNWQTIAFLPDGADRVIDVPNSWLVAGFTNATTVTLPATNVGILRVEGVIGRRTNASFEIYFP